MIIRTLGTKVRGLGATGVARAVTGGASITSDRAAGNVTARRTRRSVVEYLRVGGAAPGTRAPYTCVRHREETLLNSTLCRGAKCLAVQDIWDTEGLNPRCEQ